MWVPVVNVTSVFSEQNLFCLAVPKLPVSIAESAATYDEDKGARSCRHYPEQQEHSMVRDLGDAYDAMLASRKRVRRELRWYWP